MKKTIKLLSMILVVAIVAALSLTFTACNNKSEYKTDYVEDAQVDGLLQDFINNTKAADCFRYVCGREEIKYDLTVMKVNYQGKDTYMLKGNWVDYVEQIGESGDILEDKQILFGDYYTMNNNQKEFAHNAVDLYEFKNNAWSKSNLGYTKYEDFDMYSATTEIGYYLDRANNGYGTSICILTKTTKNGELVNYDGKITFSDKYNCQFKTIEYQGKQVISEMICATSVDRTSLFTYTMNYIYGETFEIPVVELAV